MIEKDIKICGHGSGTPSIKNMSAYLTSRYDSLATNGKHKGLVEVRRLKALTDSGRKKFHDTYATIIGRNSYNQNLRNYVYNPYKDGKYYSDCSSSICATFNKIGYEMMNANTAGIHSSNLFETVRVEIKNGHVVNPEMLKVGDCLLFVGNDPTRPLQIGHVEAVFELPENKLVPGWYKDGNSWKYAKDEHTFAKSEWMLVNHHWYYFNEHSIMVKGFQTINGEMYYFEENNDNNCEGACWHEKTPGSGVLCRWEVD